MVNKKAGVKSNSRNFLSITPKKVAISLFTGFCIPFSLLICAAFSIYFSNFAELNFTPADFLPTYLLIFLVLFIIISLALLLTDKWLHKVIFSLCTGGMICAFLQTMVTTFTFKGLPGDGTVLPPGKTQIVINLAVWFAIMAAVLFFGAIYRKSDSLKNIMVYILILITIMQTVTVIPGAITYLSEKDDKKDIYYLSTENLFELSSEDNVIVFLVDHFDRDYFLEFAESYPDTLSKLDGFTYYDDNISTYPRTYPGIPSMISGINTDFSQSRSEYFETAYDNSVFLKDLKTNDYKINLYTSTFYSHDNADVFLGIADNTEKSQGKQITSKSSFRNKMLLFTSYFWLPDFMKSTTISASSFNEVIVPLGESPQFKTTNTQIYNSLLSEKLKLQDEKNTFTFLHLYGTHPPFSTNENCEEVPANSVTAAQQTQGVFLFITEYIQQMKELGIYEDSTIIITGDHGGIDDQFTEHSNEFLTTLLVKESGNYGTPLKTSSAQVSQDNFHATIVKSADLQTNHNYGKAYSEIPEGETFVRTHYFQMRLGIERAYENITYTITGDGSDFANWEITDRENIGHMYK